MLRGVSSVRPFSSLMVGCFFGTLLFLFFLTPQRVEPLPAAVPTGTLFQAAHRVEAASSDTAPAGSMLRAPQREASGIADADTLLGKAVAEAVAAERARSDEAAAAAKELALAEKEAAVAAERVRSNKEAAAAVARATKAFTDQAAAPPAAAAPTVVNSPNTIAAAPQSPYVISSLFRAAGVASTFHAAHNPFSKFKHPRFDAVVDGGAFDGTDVLFPAFAAGYDVYSFELGPHRVNIATTLKNTIPADRYTIVRPLPGVKPTPPPRRPSPHIYFFEAGLSSRNSGVRVKFLDLMPDAYEGMEVEAGSDCSDSDPKVCVPVVRLEDVVHPEARIWLLKLDLQGHEPQAIAGATAIFANPARRPNIMSLEWWPAGMVAQGTADGGIATLKSLYDFGARCYDAGTVEGNKIPGLGVERPSDIAAWTAAFLAAPRQRPPGGDPIGAWDDLMCTFGRAE